MRKKWFVILVILASLVLVTSPVQAITNGEPDKWRHPYVGTAIFTTALGDTLYTCSGTLIAPRVFLTAGHCAIDATLAWVAFDDSGAAEDLFAYIANPDLGLLERWTSGTGIAHPDYPGALYPPNTNDIGIILLDKDVVMPVYGEIAPLGYLDKYEKQVGQQEVIFNAVGYGVNSLIPYRTWFHQRYFSEQRIINLKSALTDGYNVMFTNSPGIGHGSGGTCSGDSGGPFLLGGTNLVVAVNSFGVAPKCNGNDYAYRVDIQNSYDFLSQYVDLE